MIGRRSPVVLALAALIAGRPASTSAHQVGLSQGLYRVFAGDVAAGGEHVAVTLTFARGELRNLAREVDQDRDGELSEVEVMLGEPVIEAALVDGLRISIDERACTPRFDGASLTEEDGLEIALRYACPPVADAHGEGGGDDDDDANADDNIADNPHDKADANDHDHDHDINVDSAGASAGASTGAKPSTIDGPHELQIDLSALVSLIGAHRHIARVIPPGSAEVSAERVLHRLRARAQISLAPAMVPEADAKPAMEPAALASSAADQRQDRAGAAMDARPPPITDEPTPSPTPSPSRSPPPIDRDLAAYFTLGVEHILIGVDHLVFLLGLMIAGGRLRDWALMITAFTVGHSASLALATLGIWAPRPSIIEPLIAASIVTVGLENLLRADPAALRRRWRLTLPFGFVHGFGFAGALAEVGVRAGDGALGWVLALFNLGVEVGQLAALAMMALVLRAAPQLEGPAAKRWVSAAIALAGLAWLIARVL